MLEHHAERWGDKVRICGVSIDKGPEIVTNTLRKRNGNLLNTFTEVLLLPPRTMEYQEFQRLYSLILKERLPSLVILLRESLKKTLRLS